MRGGPAVKPLIYHWCRSTSGSTIKSTGVTLGRGAATSGPLILAVWVKIFHYFQMPLSRARGFHGNSEVQGH
jgi:hypothetical protein